MSDDRLVNGDGMIEPVAGPAVPRTPTVNPPEAVLPFEPSSAVKVGGVTGGLDIFNE